PAARRTRHVHEIRDLRQRRIAAAGEIRDLRQLDRQIVVRDGHDAVLLAVNHRDRRAPVALPRNAPVFQPVLHFAFPALALFPVPRLPASAILRVITAGASWPLYSPDSTRRP